VECLFPEAFVSDGALPLLPLDFTLEAKINKFLKKKTHFDVISTLTITICMAIYSRI